jgi:multiple sugar transport system ATP-binding protein
LIEIAGGQIWIGDRNVTWEEPSERNIGMVFQSYALYPRMTVEGNLSFGLKMAGASRAEIDKRVARAAEILRIGPYLKRRPAELSGGQRQRVAIGRALVRDVGVFLFDEPLSNLDAKLRTELRIELKRLHQELKTTSVFVTHDQIEALTLADRIAVMNGGVIQQFGTPDEVYRRPSNRFVAEFVGSPAMNFIDGTVLKKDGTVEFSIQDGPTINLDGYAFGASPADGSAATLGIRPEQLSLQQQAGAVRLPIVVNLVEPMGSDKLLWGKAAKADISMRISPDASVPVGQPFEVFFQASQASLFGVEGKRL